MRWGWVILALVIWFIIVNPGAAAHDVHNMGAFLTSVFQR